MQVCRTSLFSWGLRPRDRRDGGGRSRRWGGGGRPGRTSSYQPRPRSTSHRREGPVPDRAASRPAAVREVELGGKTNCATGWTSRPACPARSPPSAGGRTRRSTRAHDGVGRLRADGVPRARRRALPVHGRPGRADGYVPARPGAPRHLLAGGLQLDRELAGSCRRSRGPAVSRVTSTPSVSVPASWPDIRLRTGPQASAAEATVGHLPPGFLDLGIDDLYRFRSNLREARIDHRQATC
jgi:hypothetical protein